MKKNLAVSVKMLVDTFRVCSMESMLINIFYILFYLYPYKLVTILITNWRKSVIPIKMRNLPMLFLEVLINEDKCL